MVGTNSSRWIPLRTVTGHAGQPIGGDMSFFEPPPMQIGEVITAHSSLRTGKEPRRRGRARNAYIAVVWLFLGIGGYAISRGLYGLNLNGFMVGLGAIILAVLVYALAIIKPSSRACSYVGQKGVACFRMAFNPEKANTREVFLFKDAAELRTSETRSHIRYVRLIKGPYAGSSYTYTWTDESGRNRFQLSGKYWSDKGEPPTDDDYYLARSAEAAWSAYRLEHALEEWQRNGLIRFRLTGSEYLDLGPGFVDLLIGGVTARCYAQDLAQISTDRGVVTLKRKDARFGFFGLGSSGTYSFQYQSLGNARLFLLLFDKMMQWKGNLGKVSNDVTAAEMLKKPKFLAGPVFPKEHYLQSFGAHVFRQILAQFNKQELIGRLQVSNANQQMAMLMADGLGFWAIDLEVSSEQGVTGREEFLSRVSQPIRLPPAEMAAFTAEQHILAKGVAIERVSP